MPEEMVRSPQRLISLLHLTAAAAVITLLLYTAARQEADAIAMSRERVRVTLQIDSVLDTVLPQNLREQFAQEGLRVGRRARRQRQPEETQQQRAAVAAAGSPAVLPPPPLPPSSPPPSPPAKPALRSCQTPDVRQPEIWRESCQLLPYACVDQRTIILYADQFQETEKRAAKPLPDVEPQGKQSDTYYWFYRSGYEKGRIKIPGIEVRPASMFEAPPYLANPTFSNCTVPVVHYPFWADNPAHVLRDNGAKLFQMLERTEWAPHLKLVVHTPDGLQLPPFAAEIFQTLSPFSLETWADFSNRLMPGTPNGPQVHSGFPGAPELPPSFEGNHQRCFRRMYVCNNVTGSRSLPAYSFGQHVVHSYRHLLPPPPPATSPSPKPRMGEERVLKIVFQKRTGGHPGRQILNVPELLEHCNGWRYRPEWGPPIRAVCHEAEFPDLHSGIREAQAADVMIGMHGANLVNGFLMRPGSSVIEIHSPGMQTVAEHLSFSERNLLDRNTGVQWWVMMVCDSKAWEKDEVEVQQIGNYASWVKARSVRLRWPALERVLRVAVKTRGHMQLYRQRWEEGRYYWHMLKDDVIVSPGKFAKCPQYANTTASSGDGSGASGGDGGSEDGSSSWEDSSSQEDGGSSSAGSSKNSGRGRGRGSTPAPSSSRSGTPALSEE